MMEEQEYVFVNSEDHSEDESDSQTNSQNNSESSSDNSEDDSSESRVRVVLFEYKQNDPKRDTGMKLARLGLARSLRPGDPFKGIVLSAEGPCVLSCADRTLVLSAGIGCVNCSWNRLNEVCNVPGGKLSRHRKLPLLIAANPINYGKAYKLSSAEALAGGLAILGLRKFAKKLTEKFSWHTEFWKLNSDLIRMYAACASGKDILNAQTEWIRINKPKMVEEPVTKEPPTKSVHFSPQLTQVLEFDPNEVEEQKCTCPGFPAEPPKDMRKCLMLIRDRIGKRHTSGNVLAKTSRKEYLEIWQHFISDETNASFAPLFWKEFPIPQIS